MNLRLLITILALFQVALLLPAASRIARSPARSTRLTPTRSARTPYRASATNRAQRVTRSTVAPTRYKAAPRRMPNFRPSRLRPTRSIVSHFRPVLAASGLEEMPEMASPLAGLASRDLQDSFFYRRPDGMIHYAIDIFRPIGEELYSVVDGTIERIDPNPLGGNVVYVMDEEKRFRFYYAHLSRHADGLYAGMPIKRGELIGYVGDTGNAKGTQPHLHFQIASVSGAVVNPYPLLMELLRREETQLAE